MLSLLQHQACAVALFLFRRKDHDHPFSFKKRQLFRLAVFFELCSEPQQEDLALLFKEDRSSFKEHICFYFCTVLQELDGMVLLEIEVMIIGMRTEPDLLNNNLCSLLLKLFLLFFLLVKELLIVDDPAYRRIGRWSDLYEVELHVAGHLQRFVDRINSWLDAFANHAHCLCPDLFIDRVQLFLLPGHTRSPVEPVASAKAAATTPATGLEPAWLVAARLKAATASWFIKTSCYTDLLLTLLNCIVYVAYPQLSEYCIDLISKLFCKLFV
jgi:hypothetical protein